MKLHHLNNTAFVSVFLLAAVLGCAGEDRSASTLKFDRDAWIAAEGQSSRQRMIKALENELKTGMSAEEVTELLGQPDGKIDRDSGKAFIYGLGRGLIDMEEYRIIFDEDWKVTAFKQVQG